MAQQFEQPQNSQDLRSQRMTADESRAVIALWQQEQAEQTGFTDKPAVPDVAEGLGISVEDVQRLLQSVRAKRIGERALASEQELAREKLHLAAQEAELAEIRRLRVQRHRQQVSAAGISAPPSRWVEVRPGVWEDAELAAIIANTPLVTKAAKLLFRITFLLLTIGLVMSPFVYIIVLAVRQLSH